MFLEDVEIKLIGRRLHINYFQGAIIVEDIKSKREAYDYLMGQLGRLHRLSSNLQREIHQFETPEG